MLSDDDRDGDMDLDSDDDDFGLGDDDMGLGDKGNGTGLSGKPMTQAEKRAHHNMLERKRRDHIKDSFTHLRDSVPALQGEKSSRAQILKKAAEYIQFMRRKNSAHQHDIEDLKRQNHVLENQIRALERAKLNGGPRPGSNNGTSSSPVDTKMSLKSSKGRGSESDNSDGEFRNISSPESATSSSNTSNPMPNGTKKLKVLNAAK